MRYYLTMYIDFQGNTQFKQHLATSEQHANLLLKDKCKTVLSSTSIY